MDNKSIYQISLEYLQISEALIELGGEMTPELEQRLTINKEEIEVKGTGYAYVIKNITGDIDIIDAEIERLERIRGYRASAIIRLREALSGAMKLHGIEEIKTPLIKINFRKSESIEIDDVKLIDKKYLVIKELCTPDKVAIKEAIKSGEVVLGATLKQNQNLQIK